MTTSKATNSRPGVRPVGLTKDAGWEIGVSRTIAAPVELVWSFLTSEDGAAVWLGEGVELPREPRARYETNDGTAGEIRSFREGDRVRMTWQPPGRSEPATLQTAVRGDASKTMVRFHLERLADAEERERMREHWRGVLHAIERELVPGAASAG